LKRSTGSPSAGESKTPDAIYDPNDYAAVTLSS
jgi:hypothetical protein